MSLPYLASGGPFLGLWTGFKLGASVVAGPASHLQTVEQSPILTKLLANLKTKPPCHTVATPLALGAWPIFQLCEDT